MMSPKIVSLGVFATFAALGLGTRGSYAADYPSPTDEHVRLSLGAMDVFSSTHVEVDGRAGSPGTDLDGERDFGLRKSNVEPEFRATVRAATRHRVSFDYFTLDRSGDKIAARPIAFFGDVAVYRGDRLDSQLSLRMLGVTYGYSFWHSDTLELAATVGVHSTDLSSTVRIVARHVAQTHDAAGPVPTVGVDATWVASRRFYIDGRLQYMSAHVGNFDGSLGLYQLDALYRFRPNVSFGLGYTAVRAHVASIKSAQAGRFDFSTRGPVAFVRVAF
ncbi:MAG: hypothetical protein M3O06_12230 [Pseudomonadota bacterium]|nr:hypothetical protein [Pseudomonadota bacterium]